MKPARWLDDIVGVVAMAAIGTGPKKMGIMGLRPVCYDER